MATRGFSFKGLVDYVLALKDSVLGNTDRIENLTATDVGAVATADAWKRPRKSAGVVNYDTLTEAGRYICNGSNSGSTNAPMGDITFVDVSTVGGWVYQVASSYYSKKSQFFRMFRAGTDVGVPWEGYYTTANKPTPDEIGAQAVDDGGYTVNSSQTLPVLWKGKPLSSYSGPVGFKVTAFTTGTASTNTLSEAVFYNTNAAWSLYNRVSSSQTNGVKFSLKDGVLHVGLVNHSTRYTVKVFVSILG